ncbi:hypothetical protein D9M69_687940 [compost metagenome]
MCRVATHSGCAAGVAGYPRRQIQAGRHQAIVAALGHRVGAEESPAVIDDGAFPFQLVKRLGTEVLGEVLRHVEHVHWNQAFLDLCPRAAQRSDVGGVDRVDAVANKGTFTPAHHLFA